uniref:Uncharacterized protein n=1 Tax=Arundo donax TaxID=35708 RepID=A0A0A9FY10_ARUDO
MSTAIMCVQWISCPCWWTVTRVLEAVSLISSAILTQPCARRVVSSVLYAA